MHFFPSSLDGWQSHVLLRKDKTWCLAGAPESQHNLIWQSVRPQRPLCKKSDTRGFNTIRPGRNSYAAKEFWMHLTLPIGRRLEQKLRWLNHRQEKETGQRPHCYLHIFIANARVQSGIQFSFLCSSSFLLQCQLLYRNKVLLGTLHQGVPSTGPFPACTLLLVLSK